MHTSFNIFDHLTNLIIQQQVWINGLKSVESVNYIKTAKIPTISNSAADYSAQNMF